jgi:hypothetical protein
MDSKEKTKERDKSKETGSGFPFGECQAMFERMKQCCGDMVDASGCCSLIGKMKDEKRGTSEGE